MCRNNILVRQRSAENSAGLEWLEFQVYFFLDILNNRLIGYTLE